MAVQQPLPVSYKQQWATIYFMVAGSRPLSAQEILGLLSPWLKGKLKTPQMPAVKSVRVDIAAVPGAGYEIRTAPFPAGMQVSGPKSNIVTGVKWNLRTPTFTAVTDELAGSLREGFRTTVYPTLTALGFDRLVMSIAPYGKAFAVADYGIPPIPELPAPAPSPTPIPEKPKPPPPLSWLVGIAATLTIGAYLTGSPKQKPGLSRFGGCMEDAFSDRWAAEMAQKVLSFANDIKRPEETYYNAVSRALRTYARGLTNKQRSDVEWAMQRMVM